MQADRARRAAGLETQQDAVDRRDQIVSSAGKTWTIPVVSAGGGERGPRESYRARSAASQPNWRIRRIRDAPSARLMPTWLTRLVEHP